MKRIILDLAVSLDGFIEGPNGEIDWCIMEEDMNFDAFLDEVDTILFGRVSYEMFVQSLLAENTPEIARVLKRIHTMDKIIFSQSLDAVEGNARVVRDNIQAEVNDLKLGPGKNIWLYGGASIVTLLVNMGLVDEYRLGVHPVVLGTGKPLFQDIKDRVNLKFVEAKPYPKSGVVILTYKV